MKGGFLNILMPHVLLSLTQMHRTPVSYPGAVGPGRPLWELRVWCFPGTRRTGRGSSVGPLVLGAPSRARPKRAQSQMGPYTAW